MTTALYRRYRPETFAEMIGQSQVTDPLMTALRADRVGHAYLFSGPRGCGKTTSARILARCLNCAEGPTDTPCGVCDSCVELSRSGGGSLDVVEIDAASHNGVDDARDLRERAVFAPARDRFKIFILDEAHMVTQQGFNALLKLVEEPPEHVKFIFATTEPEKVLGTIRSRTHHYPFRLVPPAAMLEYVASLCEQEGVSVEPGVLPLVVRAGGGSPRDTLSLLDQLIAGSEANTVAYERAVALLGYTHTELLDDVVDAFGAGDAAAAFAAVDRVIQTGQDPRRFVDDLLERLRDLIVIAATGPNASSVLRGIPSDELDRMARQATVYGGTRLSHTADLVSTALDDMTGATSPRLHLELLVARVLTESGAIDAAPTTAVHGAPAPAAQHTPAARPSAPVEEPAPAPTTTAESVPVAAAAPEVSARPAPAHRAASEPQPGPEPEPEPEAAPTPEPEATPAVEPDVESTPDVEPEPEPTPESEAAPSPEPVAVTEAAPAPEPVAVPAAAPSPVEAVSVDRMRDAWPEILQKLEGVNRQSWLVASDARVLAFEGDVLTLAFQSQADVAKFKQLRAGAGPSEDLRAAIIAVLGVRVKYLARHDTEPAPRGLGAPPAPGPAWSSGAPAPAAPADDGWYPSDAPPNDDEPAPQAEHTPAAAPRPSSSGYAAAPVTEWAVAPIPGGATEMPLAVDDEPEEAEAAASAPASRTDEAHEPQDGDQPEDEATGLDVTGPARPTVTRRAIDIGEGQQRYGEAVVRQVLGATFVREEPYEAPTRFA
ncbi:DNA polymerase III subunit gamma and tau [Microbacterium gorillae]|uniref:DNA polymerase III subunit gamma and tau n=1 Tax=Microbacterium gorillae TaxID=1231063 RepID=UPI00058DDB90|nr:DNA polymerase III subunit gamma and tau [Microbacterium gorillae]